MTKSADAFRTISEVAEALETPAHVLRFWESRFPQIKPVKRAGGRRYYRPADMALLAGIKQLLHEDGLTIRGVQKILREHGVRHVAELVQEGAAVADADAEALPPEATAPGAAAPWPVTSSPDPAPRGATFPADPEDPVPAQAAPDPDRWPAGTLFDAPPAEETPRVPEAPMAEDVPPEEPETPQVIAFEPAPAAPKAPQPARPAPTEGTVQPDRIAARLHALSNGPLAPESLATLGLLRTRIAALRDRLSAPARPPAP